MTLFFGTLFAHTFLILFKILASFKYNFHLTLVLNITNKYG